jgi:hypothetical protein
MTTAPEGGADADDSRSGNRSLAGTARAGHLEGVNVRVGSSNVDPIEDCHRESDCPLSSISLPSSSRSQSDRGLDSAERSPDGEPEARGRGKSERSERNDAGRSRSLSAGWREVAEWCHAGEGTGHE